MNFIKKVFDGNTDDSVHLQFQKFSKGEFKNKALIECKNSSGNYTIKTSAEFANELVRIVAEKLGEEEANIKGVVVSTLDLDGELKFVKKSNFQGVKKYSINTNMTGNSIINLLDKLPKNFFALSFDSKKDNCKLKIKAKAPKSGKPGKDKEVKADFCSLKTTDVNLAQNFIFEKPNFKSAKLNHTFIIEEIVMPKGETDFAKIREMAKRKGKIIRFGEIDKEEIKKEIEFEA